MDKKTLEILEAALLTVARAYRLDWGLLATVERPARLRVLFFCISTAYGEYIVERHAPIETNACMRISHIIRAAVASRFLLTFT